MDRRLTKPEKGHQRYLRGGRFLESLACYAITKCVEGRKRLLMADGPARVVLDALDWLRQHNRAKLLAFCVMQDHYHVLLVLLPDNMLGDIMSNVGKYTAKQINLIYECSGTVWQDGFYDHHCRDIDDIYDRLTYIEHNPVRAGFVSEAALWPFSSAHPANSHLLDRHWFTERW
jgi:REP element-mobilizing transposase RayT